RQLPRGEPRALKKGPRFIGVDPDAFAGLDGRANDPKRGSESGCRKGARVAMRENCCVVRNQLYAKAAHALIAFDVFAMDVLRFGNELLFQVTDRGALASRALERPTHALDRPEEIDRSRSSHRKTLANAIKVLLEFIRSRSF